MIRVASVRMLAATMAAGLIFTLGSPVPQASADNAVTKKEILRKLLGAARRDNTNNNSNNNSNNTQRRTRSLQINRAPAAVPAPAVEPKTLGARKKIIIVTTPKKTTPRRTYALPLTPSNRRPTVAPLDPAATANLGNNNRRVRALPLDPNQTGNRRPTAAPFDPNATANLGTRPGTKKSAPLDPSRTGNRGNSGGGTKTVILPARAFDPSEGRPKKRRPSGTDSAPAIGFVSTGGGSSGSTRKANPFNGATRVITSGGSVRRTSPLVTASTETYSDEYIDGDGSIDLTVHFDLGSAEITPQAVPVLRELGLALIDPELRGKRIMIAGHTDARGSDEANLVLSNRRALTIRDFLVNEYAVDPYSLQIAGFGESDPVIPEDPYDGRNRRVQVINLGDTSQ